MRARMTRNEPGHLHLALTEATVQIGYEAGVGPGKIGPTNSLTNNKLHQQNLAIIIDAAT